MNTGIYIVSIDLDMGQSQLVKADSAAQAVRFIAKHLEAVQANKTDLKELHFMPVHEAKKARA